MTTRLPTTDPDDRRPLTTSLRALTLAQSRYRFTPPQMIETKYLGAYFEHGGASGAEGAWSVAASARVAGRWRRSRQTRICVKLNAATLAAWLS